MAIRKKTRLERLLSFNQHRKRKGADKEFQKIIAVNIAELKSNIIEGEEVNYTYGSSKDISQHIADLRDEFIGKSELLYYHAQLIVYIRREYKVKENYSAFETLWAEEQDFLLANLNTRWIVSAADTFIDYADSSLVKALAMNVVTLVNTIKINETERYLQNQQTAQDDIEKLVTLKTVRVPLFDGISAFAVGTDDSLRNMRWRLEEVAKLHPLGGMLLEVFDRVQNYDSVYKRLKERHTRKKTSWWDE